jgi:hypothetical protein
MAEVRCPMCGKSNPDDLDVCQYCQARLKPLVIPPSPEESFGETPSPGPVEEPPAEKTPSEEPPSQPDWLQPDWLQSLRQGGGAGELGEQSEPGEPESEELPDWTADEGEEAEAKESEPEGLITPGESAEATDWLDSLRPRSHIEREKPEPSDESSSEPTSESASEPTPAPDWLSDEKQPQEDIPEWLERIRSRQKSEGPQETPPLEGAEAEEFLAGLRAGVPTGEEPPVEPQTPEFTDRRIDEGVEIPAWLEDFAQTEPEGEQEGEAPETPDWLKGEEFPPIPAKPGEAFIAPAPGAPAPGEPSEQPPFAPPPPEEVEEPEWLAELEKSAGFEEEVESPAEGEANLKPEWLEDVEGEPPFVEAPPAEVPPPPEGETKVVPPFTLDEESVSLLGEETPGWLKGAPPPEKPPEISPPPVSEEGIAPAELPTWLEAMRPVEAAAPSAPVVDDRDRLIESSGPLAGLRGILPAEPEIALQKKAPTYSVKLQVPEGQQSHATILADQVKSEGIPRPVPRGPVISSQAILRVVIFVILLAAISIPALGGEFGIALPELPAEIITARNLVNAVPDNGNVLLAVDYQPGFSGEMDAAAASLLDHLMIKGAYLTLVSTSTTGPAQAEHLVRAVNLQMGHHYQDINQYANLGYIAGGASGLRSFAESPRQIMPYALDGTTVWADGRLASINALSGFDLLVVITESPETARNWIEQVEPKLGNTPLLMVVSAQLEPLVRPYYDGYPKQVDGLVSGLSGGAAYESTMPRPGLARRFWDAFSFSLPTAVLLILIGGLVNIVIAFLPARKRAEGETKS